MKREIHLNPKEKIQEWVLLGLAAGGFICMVMGVVTQLFLSGSNQSWASYMLAMIFVFLLLLGINGFFSGNLLRKWDPFQSVEVFSGIMEKYHIVPGDKINSTATRFVGFFLILFSIICFNLAIIIFLKGIVAGG